MTDEPICDTICQMEYEALDTLKRCLPGLTTGDTEAYEALMYGLLLSGLAMQMTGNSRPASGAEHHMSHLWEMAVINAPIDFYHGEKVGVGLVLASKIYHRAAEYLRSGQFTVADSVPLEEALIRESFTQPEMLDEIMAENTPSPLDAVDPDKIRANAAGIADIIEAIPQPAEIIAMIDTVRGVKSLADLGFDESYQVKTARLSPYVRNRLTLMRLLKFFDFYEDVLAAK
ncbi:iron-containing alcohol dehydrogenase [Pseudoramibacter alactolyticus]|uniref:iron-containing alcohol dehydrogenase n=1 Tax=Pseudoramibacter alactolyticus TaxID=113287 RepID=UPI0028F03994|nr:iron-containing alcohol dehydrogenase [Pseudoramibacter alactolyticus]